MSRIWRILMVEDLQQIHGKRKSQRTISKQTWLTFNPYQHRKIKQQRGKIAWSLPNFFLGIWKKPEKEDVWSIKDFLKNSEVCQNDQIITTFRILFFVVFLMMNNNWLWMALNCASNILQKFKRLINFRSFLMISGEIEVN